MVLGVRAAQADIFLRNTSSENITKSTSVFFYFLFTAAALLTQRVELRWLRPGVAYLSLGLA